MNRLVNHLGHFPMASGASQLNTTVQEHHDSSDPIIEELNPEIFKASNVQFFVLNNATLISFIEIPALVRNIFLYFIVISTIFLAVRALWCR